MEEPFKVIVAGGRDFNDYILLSQTLDHLLSEVNQTRLIEIVYGKAKGADTLGEHYAHQCGYAVKEFPADWDNLGKSAGYIRNKQMAQYADAAVCFWNGESKGTQHMINLAREYSLALKVIRY